MSDITERHDEIQTQIRQIRQLIHIGPLGLANDKLGILSEYVGMMLDDGRALRSRLAALEAVAEAAKPIVADVYQMMELIGGTMDERGHVDALARALERLP